MAIKEEIYESPYFKPLDMSGIYNRDISKLSLADCSERFLNKKAFFPVGKKIFRGIPFACGPEGNGPNNVLEISKSEVVLKLSEASHDKYIVFLHAADYKIESPDSDGIYKGMKGRPLLGDIAAEYSLKYSDGTCQTIPVKRRFGIGELDMWWGESCFEALPNAKPSVINTATEDYVIGKNPGSGWGHTQFRTTPSEWQRAAHIWLYAYENPQTSKELTEIVFKGTGSPVFIFAISLCNLLSNPLLWERRKKVVLKLRGMDAVKPELMRERFDLDLGNVISVLPVLDYDNDRWEERQNNKKPEPFTAAYIVEYTAHPAAILYVHLDKEYKIPVSDISMIYKTEKQPVQGSKTEGDSEVYCLPTAERKVKLKITEKGSSRPVAVKLHVHGTAGEYLPPVNRHRIPNPFWFEDYSTDNVSGSHFCTYIDGTAEVKLPLGRVYIEVIKGFEIAPVRKSFDIDENTDTIKIELEHVLPWRERGWVTADTHVHFLSPKTAMLEGEGEGINIVNLLASQWGELFTNVGDFDGKTTFGSKEAGGSGEYLVRVGTENRQHILGHISLLGYEGDMILPLTTGGPDESAQGDAIEQLLTGWAEQCREQNGIAILPHHPQPRAEGAASIVLNKIDGIEIQGGGGLSPYALSDWYKYLNCGYPVPAVGGTDKMSAQTAVGAVRTYALTDDILFSYEGWKTAVRNGRTFVTCGPLLDFHVNGVKAGGKIDLPSSGATLDIEWEVASVTIPITKVELIVNGDIREEKCMDASLGSFKGSFSLKMEDSGWIAIRVRGMHAEKGEIIGAHSSSVMVYLSGKTCFNPPDAVTILEQIEGAMAYVRTIGTKAEETVYKKLMLTLTSAHRTLHNRMHQNGQYHTHTAVDDHHGKQ